MNKGRRRASEGQVSKAKSHLASRRVAPLISNKAGRLVSMPTHASDKNNTQLMSILCLLCMLRGPGKRIIPHDAHWIISAFHIDIVFASPRNQEQRWSMPFPQQCFINYYYYLSWIMDAPLEKPSLTIGVSTSNQDQE